MKKAWVAGILSLVSIFVFSRMSPEFLDWHFLVTNSTTYVEVGLLALGMTFVIVAGQIDLSVASLMALVACLAALLLKKGASIEEVVGFALVAGAFLGYVNGFLVAKLKLPSFLVTLGTLAVYRGMAQAILGPRSVEIPHQFVGIDQVGVAGIPDPVLLFAILAAVTGLLLHQTVFGRWVVATGSNESAARYSGVPTEKVKIAVFVLTGVLAGIGALLMISRLGVARFDLASGQELDAITIVVVGGASIMGGQGSMLGTVLSLCLIDIIKTGMGVANVKLPYQLTVIGILLILAVLAINGSELLARWKSSRTSQQSFESQPSG